MKDIDKASNIKGLAWALGAVGLAVVFALGISPFVRAVPWSWEKNLSNSLGSTSAPNICKGDPAKEALLNRITSRLYPIDSDDAKFSVHIQVMNHPNINAFAELGGKISLNRGLLEKAESSEEIAGVLAHEMTHVKRRHILEGFVVHLMTIGGIQLMTGSSHMGWTNYFLNMGFTRSQEAEADEGALLRLQKAHVNNKGFKDFFERMKELSSIPAFLSDHPADQSRSEQVEKFENKDTQPIMTPDEWKLFKGYCK